MSNDTNRYYAERVATAATASSKIYGRRERGHFDHIPAASSALHEQSRQAEAWESRMKRLNPHWTPYREAAADIG